MKVCNCPPQTRFTGPNPQCPVHGKPATCPLHGAPLWKGLCAECEAEKFHEETRARSRQIQAIRAALDASYNDAAEEETGG